jgi:hypothetical protein
MKRTIIIVVLFGILWYQNCRQSKKTGPNLISINGTKFEVIKREIDTTEILRDTIIYKSGKNIYHDTTIFVPYPVDKPIDTAQILADYMAKNVFKDTLKLPDSLGWVYLLDTIQQNKLLGRTFSAQVKSRTVSEKIYLRDLPKSRLYAGGSLSKSIMGASLIYDYKQKTLFEFGVVKPFRSQPELKLGVLFHLR